MSWEQSIDILAIIGLFAGIVFAAYYQRATVMQMRRQSDATIQSLTALNDQTAQMQQQTEEMRASIANESRPVLFATVANTSPPSLNIGNHGRNPASDLRMSLSLPLKDSRGQTIDESESYPSLPGWYRLVFALTEPELEGSATAVPGADWEVPDDFLLELTIRYHDAITRAAYTQHIKAEVDSTLGAVRLEPIPYEGE